MVKITKDILKVASSNLLFDMHEEEYDTLLKEFDVILKQMEFIGTIEGVDEETPMTFPFLVTNSYLREDEPSEPLTREDALKNAHDVVEGQIKLPKVVG